MFDPRTFSQQYPKPITINNAEQMLMLARYERQNSYNGHTNRFEYIAMPTNNAEEMTKPTSCLGDHLHGVIDSCCFLVDVIGNWELDNWKLRLEFTCDRSEGIRLQVVQSLL